MMEKDRAVRNVCPRNCPDTCGIISYVKNGKIIKIEGDSSHPITQGRLCHKGYQSLSVLYSRDRILHPMKRVGAKGEGKFERISWDEALDTIADKYKEAIAQHTSESILPYWYSGELGLVHFLYPMRFFGKMGASNLQLVVCSAAGENACAFTQGPLSMDPEDFVNAKLIVIWGANMTETNPHIWPIITKAMEQGGAKLIVVDPHRNMTASMAGIHLQPNIGTDAALALGMANVIISNDLHDSDYIEKNTIGFDQLKEKVSQYPLEKVEKITGIPAADIERVAVRYASTKPAAIWAGFGMQRHTNGGMMIRSISFLPAICGQWGQHGGGLGYHNVAHFFNYNIGNLIHPEIFDGEHRAINMVLLGDALLNAEPPVKVLHVYNSNPGAMLPDQNNLRKGLSREDLFTVVHDLFITDTADYADIFLPAATFFEKPDIHQGYRFLYCQLNEQAIEPLGEARSGVWVFNQLAERMGFTEPCFKEGEEDIIKGALDTDNPFMEGITYERLKKEGAVHLNTPTTPYVIYADGKFGTDSGKIELYSEKMKAEGLDPVAEYVPLQEGPEISPELFAKYPIYLLTGSTSRLCNTTYANTEFFQTIDAVPTVKINPEDAAARGVSEGDWVYVENDRGSAKLMARLSDAVKPGVAFTVKDYWPKLSPDKMGANFTTPDYIADMGGGPCYQTNLVQIRKA
jgi:anaerobic selenocysteine-containing dehydrogenase